MKKISKEEQMMKNGGAGVRAICWTCKSNYGDSVVWANNGYALTKKSAKIKAIKGLTKHSDGEMKSHNFGFYYL